MILEAIAGKFHFRFKDRVTAAGILAESLKDKVCNPLNYVPGCRPAEAPDAAIKLIVNKAKPLFGVDLPLGRESSTFIQNVTQLAKEGFDSPENAKLFLQLDSIALNSTSSHPGNITLTNSTINHIISVYNQMKKK